MTNATAIRITTAVTRSHTAELPDGSTIDLPHSASDHIDPFLSEDGNTFRYASLDECPFEHEWQEGVEWFTGDTRSTDYVDADTANERFEELAATHDIYSVDVYEHGQVMFSLSGGGPQCQFDTAVGGAAIAVPNYDRDPSGFTDTREAAAAMLDEYTSWCNGDVYFITEMTRDPATGEWDEGETLGGFVGWDHTEQMLKEGF